MSTEEYDRLEIASNWLPRYTGMQLDEFGEWECDHARELIALDQ